jgi:hypothetical protein
MVTRLSAITRISHTDRTVTSIDVDVPLQENR